MIYGIGNDIIEIERVMKACSKESFLKRVYTDSERREALTHRRRLAGDFAVKEAVSKALGTGFAGFAPSEIEVLRDEYGKPYVKLYDRAAALAEEAGISRIHVSISDISGLVCAFAVAECE